MKMFREDIALEILKTLMTSDQRDLQEQAAKSKVKIEKASAQVSFKFADAFLEESQK